jgi:hypothetical protein
VAISSVSADTRTYFRLRDEIAAEIRAGRLTRAHGDIAAWVGRRLDRLHLPAETSVVHAAGVVADHFLGDLDRHLEMRRVKG